MKFHQTNYRVIYADTDNMGVAYHANYLKWFEVGRTEMFRSYGLSYKAIEEKGYIMPVSEAYCKYLASAAYDDVITIETSVDTSFRAGMKFEYRIFRAESGENLVKGFTKHAFVNADGRIVRPPGFIKAVLEREVAG
ncbi:MAG: acyl-CoA thioesterase [Deltaproteobacteria bacterium]|jgi:acyl-CoA thioester hydrolase|nr:acyl-CoA thioesterase [Deltaproteobacteria bacterium]